MMMSLDDFALAVAGTSHSQQDLKKITRTSHLFVPAVGWLVPLSRRRPFPNFHGACKNVQR
jgi:hypothetical protein